MNQSVFHVMSNVLLPLLPLNGGPELTQGGAEISGESQAEEEEHRRCREEMRVAQLSADDALRKASQVKLFLCRYKDRRCKTFKWKKKDQNGMMMMMMIKSKYPPGNYILAVENMLSQRESSFEKVC